MIARCVLLCASAGLVWAQAPAFDPNTPVAKDFNKRVGDYLKIHKTARGQVHRLKPTNSPSEITHYEHELARRIRRDRAAAKQGDIFTPDIAAQFRQWIGLTMHGPEAARIQQTLAHAAPVTIRGLRVNMVYPSAVPLQTTPPSLLLNLPPLPPELDYRVVGHNLVLRDVEANVIVDFIPDAIP